MRPPSVAANSLLQSVEGGAANQSARASSSVSRIRSRRCSGEFTMNTPSDQYAQDDHRLIGRRQLVSDDQAKEAGADHDDVTIRTPKAATGTLCLRSRATDSCEERTPLPWAP
jgi:hypothetical protein